MKTKYINPFQPYEAMGTISILIRGGLQLKCNISLCHEIHSTFILNNDFDNYLHKNLANHIVSEKNFNIFREFGLQLQNSENCKGKKIKRVGSYGIIKKSHLLYSYFLLFPCVLI